MPEYLEIGKYHYLGDWQSDYVDNIIIYYLDW